MTVEELIKILENCPKEYTVTVDNIELESDSVDTHDEWKEVDLHV